MKYLVIVLLIVVAGCSTTQSREEEPSYPQKTEQPPAADKQPAKPEPKEDKASQDAKKQAELEKKAQTAVNKIEIERQKQQKETLPADPKSKTEVAVATKITIKNEPMPEEPRPKAPEKKETPVAKVKPAKKNLKKFFHLRIISLPHHHKYYQDRVQGIVKFLKKKGIKDAIARTSSDRKGNKYWVVDVGKFEEEESIEAKALKEKIRNMKYEGIYQFKDALYYQY